MRPSVFPIFIVLLACETAPVQAQASYPVVSKAEQKARDKDRRLILETELRVEHQRLAEARAEFDGSHTVESRERMHRHTENVKALLRELAGTAVAQDTRAPRTTVRATLSTSDRYARVPIATASFWNPYNRAHDPADSPTPQRKETP